MGLWERSSEGDGEGGIQNAVKDEPVGGFHKLLRFSRHRSSNLGFAESDVHPVSGGRVLGKCHVDVRGSEVRPVGSQRRLKQTTAGSGPRSAQQHL